jgi:hypothetical protein
MGQTNHNMEHTREEIITLIEQNKLADAIDKLIAFAQIIAPEQETAVRLKRATLNELKQEELLFGKTTNVREQRNALKLQLIQLANALAAASRKSPASSSGIDTAALKQLFRAGEFLPLFTLLEQQLNKNSARYDELLLIEQEWKNYSHQSKNSLASADVLAVQRNQINQRILTLINELGG